MRNEKGKGYFMVKSLLVIIAGVLLALNLVIAEFNPGYVSAVTKKVEGMVACISGDSIILSEYESISPALAQGGVKGVNIKKAKEVIEKTTGGADDEVTKPSEQTPKQKAAPRKKKSPEIDPEVLDRALRYFQEVLIERDVIEIGQTDQLVLGDKIIERPYISKSFRDNPFDMVQEVDINPVLNVKKLPPEPFYPPPGGPTISITGEEFKNYVRTLKLKGVMIIDDKFFALIQSGGNRFYRKPGEDYKDKFLVNIVDVSLDTVLISDEFGNKGLLDFDFRRGFQVQPFEDTLFIANVGY